MCNGPWEKAQRVLAIFGDMWNKYQLGLGHELDKIPHIYLPEILGKGGHNDLPTVDLGLVR